MMPENHSCLPVLRLGVLVNPRAGLGGPTGYKGSDHLPDHITTDAEARGSVRLRQVLQGLSAQRARLDILCPAGVMGENAVREAGLPYRVLYQPGEGLTTALDTREAARAMQETGMDVLLFAGGDGTARDLCEAGVTVPVLGVPSGVKMHSGVFAVSPADALALVEKLLAGGGVAVEAREVRDLDEEALRAGQVRPRFYGELSVPVDTRLVQQVKCATQDDDALAQTEIAAGFIEMLDPHVAYLFGPGTTTGAVMEALGLPHTVLGFDAVLDGKLLGADLDHQAIAALAETHPVCPVLTFTGGQGILLGRGNQQLTPSLLRRIGRGAVRVLATPSKLRSLAGRPMRLDTGDAALDQTWAGLIRVLTGYRQEQMVWLA